MHSVLLFLVTSATVNFLLTEERNKITEKTINYASLRLSICRNHITLLQETFQVTESTNYLMKTAGLKEIGIRGERENIYIIYQFLMSGRF